VVGVKLCNNFNNEILFDRCIFAGLGIGIWNRADWLMVLHCNFADIGLTTDYTGILGQGPSIFHDPPVDYLNRAMVVGGHFYYCRCGFGDNSKTTTWGINVPVLIGCVFETHGYTGIVTFNNTPLLVIAPDFESCAWAVLGWDGAVTRAEPQYYSNVRIFYPPRLNQPSQAPIYPATRSGVATLSAGSTRVTVSHGLVATPTKVLITPLGQPPGKLWVENITSSSFDIVTDTAPTSNLNIAWYAEV